MTQTSELAVSERYDLHGPPPPSRREYLTRGGWVRAAWMTALFFGIGLGITLLVRWAEGWHPIWDGQVITTVELAAVPFGFLAGLEIGRAHV